MKSNHRNAFKPIKTQDHIESEKHPSTKDQCQNQEIRTYKI